jgi:hypothetical protein
VSATKIPNQIITGIIKAYVSAEGVNKDIAQFLPHCAGANGSVAKISDLCPWGRVRISLDDPEKVNAGIAGQVSRLQSERRLNQPLGQLLGAGGGQAPQEDGCGTSCVDDSRNLRWVRAWGVTQWLGHRGRVEGWKWGGEITALRLACLTCHGRRIWPWMGLQRKAHFFPVSPFSYFFSPHLGQRSSRELTCRSSLEPGGGAGSGELSVSIALPTNDTPAPGVLSPPPGGIVCGRRSSREEATSC